MAQNSGNRVGRFAEVNSQPRGRTGSATPVKRGPAVAGGSGPSHRPNGGPRGGVFRTPKKPSR